MTRAELGVAWPLTVDSAVVACRDDLFATVTINGVEYRLNGTAKAKGYPEIPARYRLPYDQSGPAIPDDGFIVYSPLLERALQLCPRNQRLVPMI